MKKKKILIFVIILIIICIIIYVIGSNHNSYTKEEVASILQEYIYNVKQEKGIEYVINIENDIKPIIEKYGKYNESDFSLKLDRKNTIYVYDIVKIPLQEYIRLECSGDKIQIISLLDEKEFVIEYITSEDDEWKVYENNIDVGTTMYVRAKNMNNTVISNNIFVTKDMQIMPLANEKWNVENLSYDIPYVKENIDGVILYAPIPKGFVASEATGEDSISNGLVIYEGNEVVNDENVETEKTIRNQFVWVPINSSYDIEYALDMEITDTTALQYWENSKEGIGVEGKGYNEPYPRTEGSWTKEEWDAMYESAMKYEGFYIGRYEVGQNKKGEFSVVQTGFVTSRTEINETEEMGAEPITRTALGISRDMYMAENENFGVISNLMYGIQKDTVMNWANCVNKIRPLDTYDIVRDSPARAGAPYKDGVTYDIEKNIYDLAGNVREYTMEAYGDDKRVRVGGHFTNENKVSIRLSSSQTFSCVCVGFRVALYFK